jgi:hypothetical protein
MAPPDPVMGREFADQTSRHTEYNANSPRQEADPNSGRLHTL